MKILEPLIDRHVRPGCSGLKRTRIMVLAGFAVVANWIGLTQCAAQSVVPLYSFTGRHGDANPLYVTPVQGRDGQLYGSAYQKSGGAGAVFRLSTSGQANIPHVFSGSDGSNPLGGLLLASDGNLYGTTGYGGTANDGVLFKISPEGTYSVLHEFQGGTDGMVPVGPPIEGVDGNLYGTTFGLLGGANSTVYKYGRSGSLTTIYQFNQADGQFVYGPLVLGMDGYLYGTSALGGANNCGTIFKLTTSGAMQWNYSFPCGLGGAEPFAPLIQASDGNLYGTTDQGGDVSGQWGTIFRVSKSGKVSILHRFTGNGRDGINPLGGLVQATDGKLYGVTSLGGKYNAGALFQISTSGEYALLSSFESQLGQNPYAAPLQHTNGLLYGTTSAGGRFGFGSVYSVNLGLPAFIALVQSSGKIGSTVAILGQGLTGTTGVTFNGIPASSFRVISDTYLTATVPNTATTGPVLAITQSGTVTSNKSFRIIGTGNASSKIYASSSSKTSRALRSKGNR